jgi:hypothetical protein
MIRRFIRLSLPMLETTPTPLRWGAAAKKKNCQRTHEDQVRSLPANGHRPALKERGNGKVIGQNCCGKLEIFKVELPGSFKYPEKCGDIPVIPGDSWTCTTIWLFVTVRHGKIHHF